MLWAAAILFALFPPAGAAVATVSTISTRYGRPVGSHPHVRAVREHARKQGATARNALAPQRDNNAFVARTRTSIVPQSTDISAMEPNEKPGKVTLKDRFKNLFQKMNLDRKRMAELGLGCLLSYGFVSNINVGILTSIAWGSFSLNTGLSPLAPGQWAKFVAVQVGLYAVFGNLLRPLRLAISIAIAPMFDRIISFLQTRLKIPKSMAVLANVVIFNFIINIAFMVTGIWLASTIVGVPAIPAEQFEFPWERWPGWSKPA
uniref:Uncharacterized protein n=1 Tax=Lotharella globosa TaxID=91324 RepID=A0A7S3Z103_9EUKA|mmetsp:Transcript_21543/g.43256  ORF Transcript_21543/g.43256 Transcript_21543/m.43256 type:complete len:261 (-) Transcript_21543:235-1017(-)